MPKSSGRECPKSLDKLHLVAHFYAREADVFFAGGGVVAGYFAGQHALDHEAMLKIELQGGYIIVGGGQDDLRDALAAEPLFKEGQQLAGGARPLIARPDAEIKHQPAPL